MTPEKIFIAADHGGYQLKEELKVFLIDRGYEVKDVGTHSKDAVDYPDLAFLVAQAVAGTVGGGGDARGIIVDSIGQASAIVANKIPNIRAVVAHDDFSVNSSREHNDANVLCLGGQVHGIGLARHLLEIFLKTPYPGGRHQRRLDKIREIEKQFSKR